MKKVLFFSLLLFSFSSYSQMVDLMGSLSVQGVITSDSAASTSRGLSIVQKTRLLQDINQAAMEIKTQFFGNYTGVNSQSVSDGLFSGLDYQINSTQDNLFYIQINQLDNQTCKYLISSGIPAQSIRVNNNSQECSFNNNIKFIFN